MMGQYEEGASIGTAKDDVDRPLRHLNQTCLLARRIVDKDLAVGYEHVASTIHRYALPAALYKRLQIAQRTGGVHQRAVGAIFRFAAHVDSMPWNCIHKTIRIQVV